MPNYQDTIIYKLCCNDATITDIYVGSTCNFSRRKHEHKMSCKHDNQHNHNVRLYQKIREHEGFENWSMIQLEAYPCDNKREKEARERYWVDELKPSLNVIQNVVRSENDMREWNKKYEQTEDRKAYVRDYWKGRKKTCPQCGKEIDAKSISTHKKKWCKFKPEQ